MNMHAALLIALGVLAMGVGVYCLVNAAKWFGGDDE